MRSQMQISKWIVVDIQGLQDNNNTELKVVFATVTAKEVTGHGNIAWNCNIVDAPKIGYQFELELP